MKKFFGISLNATGKVLATSSSFNDRDGAVGWASGQLHGANLALCNVHIVETVAVAERQASPVKITELRDTPETNIGDHLNGSSEVQYDRDRVA